MLKNSTTSYGTVTKLFHWIMAILVLLQYYYVYWKQYVLTPKSEQAIFYIRDLHKPFGVLILILVVFRILWRHLNTKVENEPSLPEWENKAAFSTHILLYLFLLLLPTSGILMSHAAGYSVSFFNLFNLTTFIEKNKSLQELFYNTHVYLSYIALTFVVLHILAGLRHHFILKNNVLKRMLP